MNLYAVGRPVVKDEGGYWIAYYVLATTPDVAREYLEKQFTPAPAGWHELPEPMVALVAANFNLSDEASHVRCWPMSMEAAAGHLAPPPRRLYAVGKQTGDWLKPWQALLVRADSPAAAAAFADDYYGPGWWHSHPDEATVVLVADQFNFAPEFADRDSLGLPSSGGELFPENAPTAMPETDLGYHDHLR